MIKKIIIVINLFACSFLLFGCKKTASSNLEEEITKGNLYTISETFEMGYYDEEQLQALLKIYKSEETIKVPLDSNIKKGMEQELKDYLSNIKDENYKFKYPNISIEDIEITRFIGKYNRCYSFTFKVNSLKSNLDKTKVEIAKLSYEYTDFPIMVFVPKGSFIKMDIRVEPFSTTSVYYLGEFDRKAYHNADIFVIRSVQDLEKYFNNDKFFYSYNFAPQQLAFLSSNFFEDKIIICLATGMAGMDYIQERKIIDNGNIKTVSYSIIHNTKNYVSFKFDYISADKELIGENDIVEYKLELTKK